MKLYQLEGIEGTLGLYSSNTEFNYDKVQELFDEAFRQSDKARDKEDHLGYRNIDWDTQGYVDDYLRTYDIYRVYAETVTTEDL